MLHACCEASDSVVLRLGPQPAAAAAAAAATIILPAPSKGMGAASTAVRNEN
jgi:hypothetical protein